MGSYVTSNSTSTYKNTPNTISDNTNPLTLADAVGNQVGGSGNVNGALNASQNYSTRNGALNVTSLDGGAISAAFQFGQNAITAIASLTKQANEAVSTNNAAALGFTERANTTAQTLVDKSENAVPNAQALGAKTLWILGALVVGGYFFWKRGK